MKDLLSKEHCCYKINTLMKSSAYPPSIDNPPLWATPLFLQENLDLSFYDFSKISTPYKQGGFTLCHEDIILNRSSNPCSMCKNLLKSTSL